MKSRIFLTAIVLLSLASCVTPRVVMDTPDGFSPYRDADGVKMITPEGMRLRIKLLENDPPQTITFWSTALEAHMTDSGYTLLEKGTVADSDGVWFEWVAPVDGADWIYLNALYVREEHIVLVESAAEEPLYREYRPAIQNALPSVSIQ